MSKILKGRTTLSIEKAPVRKMKETKREKLGLLTEKTRKLQTFRLLPNVIYTLKEITNKVNKKSSIKISMGTILELIIMDMNKKNINEIMELTRSN